MSHSSWGMLKVAMKCFLQLQHMQECKTAHRPHVCSILYSKVITHRNQNLLVSALLFLSFGNNDELTIHFDHLSGRIISKARRSLSFTDAGSSVSGWMQKIFKLPLNLLKSHRPVSKRPRQSVYYFSLPNRASLILDSPPVLEPSIVKMY